MSPRWLHWPVATPSGPTLIIHDTFTSGSTTWNGRTPDTLNLPSGSWTKPKTSPGFTADTTGGFGYRSQRSTDGSLGEYKDTIVIPTNSAACRIVSDVMVPTTSLNSHAVGVCFWDSSGLSSGAENFVALLIGFNNTTLLREVISGTETNLASSNAVTYTSGSRYILDVEVSGTSASANVFDSTGTTELVALSTSSITLSSSNNAGCLFMGVGSSSSYGRVYDFKVYT